MKLSASFSENSRFVARNGLTLLLCASLLAGCAAPERLEQPPGSALGSAVALNIPNARFLVDEHIEPMIREGELSAKRELQALGVDNIDKLPPSHFLAISGDFWRR